MATVKEQARELLDELPDDASWDELMYRIYVRQKIALGIEAANKGRIQSHEEVRQRFLPA